MILVTLMMEAARSSAFSPLVDFSATAHGWIPQPSVQWSGLLGSNLYFQSDLIMIYLNNILLSKSRSLQLFIFSDCTTEILYPVIVFHQMWVPFQYSRGLVAIVWLMKAKQQLVLEIIESPVTSSEIRTFSSELKPRISSLNDLP
jgi:hypothetical protein